LNGLLLPFVSLFLLIALNDRNLMGEEGINGRVANLLLGAVVLVTMVLGFSALARALVSALGLVPTGSV